MNFIIVPTYNERENIPFLLKRIFTETPDVQVIIVDDNSPDGTAALVQELQVVYPRLILRSRPSKQGLASAYLETISWIMVQYPQAQVIITMDADLSHDPADVPRLLQALQSHDLAVGSRYAVGGGLKDWPFFRRQLSKWGNTYATWVTRVPIRDLTAGFVAFSVPFLRQLDLSSVTAQGFAYTMQIKVYAYTSGARVIEVPIIFSNRERGTSKISNHIIREGLVAPWKLRVRQKV